MTNIAIMHLNRCVLASFNIAKGFSRISSGIFNVNINCHLIKPNLYSHQFVRFYESNLEIQSTHFDFLKSFDHTNIDWNELRAKCIDKTMSISSKNVDAIIMQYFLTQSMFNEALIFKEYLKNKPIEEINLGTIGKMLKAYYAFGKNGLLKDKDVEHIYHLYEYLTKKYPLLDTITNESLIKALSNTPKWKECIDLLNKCKDNNLDMKSDVYNSIGLAAINNNEIDFAWDFIEKTIKTIQKIVFNDFYLSWIKYCVDNYKDKVFLDGLEKLLFFTYENNIVFKEYVAIELCKAFQKLGWTKRMSRINPDGVCYCCNEKLESIVLSNKEYDYLKNEFYSRVLVCGNAFLKTSPEELQRFLKYLQNRTFDVVLDGLNIAYSKKVKNNKNLSHNLVAVVNKYLDENKEILILGRKHMLYWPKSTIEFLKNNTHLFLTDDLSYDDPFLIYAALSFPNTIFVSRDKMRQHKFQLQNPELLLLFHRWQETHQHSVSNINKYGKVYLKYPNQFAELAQKSVNWHIPYKIYNNNVIDNEEEPVEIGWLCMKPPNKFSRNV